MEKILQHSIVKQGLIIAYYFSNRWYRKCLFNESSIPVSTNSDPEEITQPDLGHTRPQKKADSTCVHTQENNSTEEIKQSSKEKSNWNEPVKNPAISKDTA